MSYSPANPPVSAEDTLRYLYAELQKIQTALDEGVAKMLEVSHAAPLKPREGMLRRADGAHWNPGSGTGVYVYLGGTWVLLSGGGGGGGSGDLVYISVSAPTVPPSTPYLWIQTGLGPGGADATFWIEDGL